MVSNIIVFFIRIYQKCISPLFGPHCRFSPTCSQYTIEAVKTHGAFKGIILGTWRILRCNPYGKSGFDPVPQKGSWKNSPN